MQDDLKDSKQFPILKKVKWTVFDNAENIPDSWVLTGEKKSWRLSWN